MVTGDDDQNNGRHPRSNDGDERQKKKAKKALLHESPGATPSKTIELDDESSDDDDDNAGEVLGFSGEDDTQTCVVCLLDPQGDNAKGRPSGLIFCPTKTGPSICMSGPCSAPRFVNKR